MSKGIRKNLGCLFTRDATFREQFFAIVNDMLTKEEFELAWQDLCYRYKIADNPFMIRTFQCREKLKAIGCSSLRGRGGELGTIKTLTYGSN